MPLEQMDPAKLLSLHLLTKDVSQACLRQIKAHFAAIAPLFRPRRFLGDHIEGTSKEGAVNADRNWTELQELYRRVAVKPFDLRPELRSPLESTPTQFSFGEWEYLHTMRTSGVWRSIHVTQPLVWVLSYSSTYSFPTLRDVVQGNGQRDGEAIGSFVLRACIMHELVRKFPAMKDLLAGLHFKLEVRTTPQLGELPLVTLSAPFKTIRPPDDLVAFASGMAGGMSFSEVLDVESVYAFPDPFRDEIANLFRKHKLEL